MNCVLAYHCSTYTKSSLWTRQNNSVLNVCFSLTCKVYCAVLIITVTPGRSRGQSGSSNRQQGLPWWLSGKESACSAGDAGDAGPKPQTYAVWGLFSSQPARKEAPCGTQRDSVVPGEPPSLSISPSSLWVCGHTCSFSVISGKLSKKTSEGTIFFQASFCQNYILFVCPPCFIVCLSKIII